MPEPEHVTYREAVNRSLRRCLEDFPESFILGEDIALPGGVFGCTKGLHKDFADRVLDTPISEAAILGTAIGAAMVGRRPIAEIMFMDFTLVALDQIVNQAANVRYVTNGRLGAPIVIRTQQGALPGSCAQHSQCLEAFFAHVPGLRVVLPVTPQDVYDTILTAVSCDDPVMVIEHRALYGTEGPLVEGGEIESIGGTRTVRTGTDVTVVTWGTVVAKAEQAAAELAGQGGPDVEIIDLKWLNPLDLSAVFASAEKTSRVLIAHEANVTGGFGAEVAARIAEQVPHALDAPIRRVGLPDLRMPAAPALSRSVLPSVEGLVQEIKELAEH